ncbi:MAG TPA: ferredoxin reductase [Kineosporiaceae bacterium]|nr:ferredoxin reductase [Kineosporiaceae bacterium]
MSRHAVFDGLRRLLTPLAGAVATPRVPADYLDLFAPLRSGTHRARVVDVQPETDACVTLVLQPAGRWPGHRAGQSVRLGVEVDGVRLWRSYSLTAPPGPDGMLRVAVSAIPGGRASGYLVHRVRPGTVVGLEGPDGDFGWTDPMPAKALFVTGGSGITPVIGMLREAIGRDLLPDVVVVHSARAGEGVIFGTELREWHRQGRLRLVERHTATDGRLDAAQLSALVGDLAERETWACGPNGLVDLVTALAEEQGRAANLHTERFRPVVTVAGEGGSVTFARSGRTVTTDGTTTLLTAGEAAHVPLPSGCRMGICFRCVVPLAEGAVRDTRDGTLTTAEPGGAGYVQTCVSSAAGPCTLDA